MKFSKFRISCQALLLPNVDAHGKPSTMFSVRGACGADKNPKCKQHGNTNTTRRIIAREGVNALNKNENTNAQQQTPKQTTQHHKSLNPHDKSLRSMLAKQAPNVSEPKHTKDTSTNKHTDTTAKPTQCQKPQFIVRNDAQIK